jgi:hypothetical protein
VPNIRLAFRHKTLMEELNMIKSGEVEHSGVDAPNSVSVTANSVSGANPAVAMRE